MAEFNEIKHILLLDDDEDDFFILKEVVETYFPLVRVSYRFGCEQSDQSIFDHVDLVLLDINMPRLSGFQCLDVIRREYGLARLPVVMYSNSFATSDLIMAYRHGANLYVNKPLTFETIRRCIGELFSIDWTNIDEITRKNRSSNKILRY